MGAKSIATLCAGLSAILLLAMTALLLTDVIGRAFGHPLFGAQDLAEMAMVVMIFAALPLLDQRGGQIRVDLMTPVMPAWLIHAGDRVAAVIGAALWLALAKATLDSAALSSLLSLASNILKLPKAPVQYAVAALVTVAACGNLARAFARGPR